MIIEKFDWRDKGVVSQVKDQGQCGGSSWAFAAIAAVESAYAIKTGKNVILSEQELVDCTNRYGGQGCNGGLPDQAFEYIKNHGISLEAKYRYSALNGICKSNKDSELIYISDYKIPTNENELLDTIPTIQQRYY